MARRDSAEPVGAFHNSANLNLAKRRLCAALGISQGVPNIAARFPSPVSVLHAPPPSADRTAPWPDAPISAQQKAAPIFMIRPPTAQSGESNYAHRSRPYHGSRNSGDSAQPVQHGNRHEGQQAPRVVQEQRSAVIQTACAAMRWGEGELQVARKPLYRSVRLRPVFRREAPAHITQADIAPASAGSRGR